MKLLCASHVSPDSHRFVYCPTHLPIRESPDQEIASGDTGDACCTSDKECDTCLPASRKIQKHSEGIAACSL